MKPSLCLNMIVRNESARIERCLASVLPYVKAAFIYDTGSTDGTQALINKICGEHAVPVLILAGEFKDFSQARNAAFKFAKADNGTTLLPWCQFALLVDADMELVVTDPNAFAKLDATAASYDMMQKGGSVSYGNRRIVNLNVDKEIYLGVTHEYIDLPAAGMIEGAMFVDHADGFNRKDKFERDAQLLEDALKLEPENGRYWYYLGNTYRDWGKPMHAIRAYDKRIKLGGWDEETHSAMMNVAAAERDNGNEARFVAGMLDAYNFRPQRAEPLYDLARYYREKGNNAAALLFAAPGMEIKPTGDLLFVNDFVYEHGLRYEYSIAAYSDEAHRSRAFAVTNDLALDPSCPHEFRWSSRSNLFWYTQPLSHYCPSFKGTKIGFTPPAGYQATNPSVEVSRGLITCNVRCVNYVMDEQGRYMIGPKECGDAPIDTRNFVVTLDPETYVAEDPAEVLWHRPTPKFDMVTGLEDIRLWRFGGKLHFSATVRELSQQGVCQIVVGGISYDDKDLNFMRVQPDWHVVSDDVSYEKNWMPTPADRGLPRFMYRLDTVVELGTPNIVTKIPSDLHVGDISGSSQLIPFKAGYLAVTHEASNDPNKGKRTYWHRFAWFDKDLKLRRLSLPFVFYDRQIEFCSGLARHPNNSDILISFGVRDREAHVATVLIEEVALMLWKLYE